MPAEAPVLPPPTATPDFDSIYAATAAPVAAPTASPTPNFDDIYGAEPTPPPAAPDNFDAIYAPAAVPDAPESATALAETKDLTPDVPQISETPSVVKSLMAGDIGQGLTAAKENVLRFFTEQPDAYAHAKAKEEATHQIDFGQYPVAETDSRGLRYAKEAFNTASQLMSGVMNPQTASLIVAGYGTGGTAAGMAANRIAAGVFALQSYKSAGEELAQAARKTGPEAEQHAFNAVGQLATGGLLTYGAAGKIPQPGEKNATQERPLTTDGQQQYQGTDAQRPATETSSRYSAPPGGQGAAVEPVQAPEAQNVDVAEPIGVTETLAELDKRAGRAPQLPTPENKGLSQPTAEEGGEQESAAASTESGAAATSSDGMAPSESAPVAGAPTLGLRGFGPGAASAAEPLRSGLFARIRDRLFSSGDGEPKANYSGIGALRSYLGQGLRETEQASEPVYLAARRAAASAAQARNMLNDAAGAVKKALGGTDAWNEFKGALVESRLRGIRRRWDDISKAAGEATDKELSGDNWEHMMDLLGNVRGRIEGTDPLETAIALKQSGDYDNLRAHLEDTFAAARDRVGTIRLAETFEKMISEPKFQDGLALYKKLIEGPLKENHAINEGVFSDALGPLDTYFPLSAASESEPASGRVGYGGRLNPYKKPINARNKFATGLSPEYDLGDEPLHKAVAMSVRMNNTAALIDELQNQGLMVKLKPDEPGQSSMMINGEEYQTATVPIGPQRLVKDKFGRSVVIPQQRAVLPIWLSNELRPVLESGKFTKYDVVNLLDKINNYAISGPLDAVFHSANVLGTITAATPWAGTDLISKTIGNTPVTKVFTTMANLMRMDPTTPESIAKIQEMSKLGVIPTKYSSPQAIKGLFGRFLYGTKGLDIRGRLLAYELFKDINPNGTKPEMIKFIDQLGNYVPQMNGVVERYLKANRVAPFYEAGKQMYLNGIKSVLGTTPIPQEGLSGARRFGLRLAQQLSGGTAGTVGLWALTYRAYTGQWPWDDKRARLMEIPLNPADRNSRMARELWGNNHNTAYAKFDFFDPIIGRGLRALGVRGLANKAMESGKLAGLGIEEGTKDAINSAVGPVTSSPLLRAATVATLGVEPQLSSLRDKITGRPTPEFYSRSNKKSPGVPQRLENLKQGALELNTFVRNIADGTGLGEQSYNPEEDQGNRFVRMIVDTVFPRLLGGQIDVDKRIKSDFKELKAAQHQKK